MAICVNGFLNYFTLDKRWKEKREIHFHREESQFMGSSLIYLSLDVQHKNLLKDFFHIRKFCYLFSSTFLEGIQGKMTSVLATKCLPKFVFEDMFLLLENVLFYD